MSRALSDAAMDALERRYAKWARDRGLTEDASGRRFEGRLLVRDVVFATGLGGSAPSPPDIVVAMELPIDAPKLVRRRDVAAAPPDDAADGSDVTRSPTRLLGEVLAVSDQIRNIGLTPRFVRITFEPSVGEDVLDAALEALEERLRLLTAAQDLPYRG